MTFIEMLQQGGYILPQFSSGQQTYQAPNNGMQALQTMMQVDQQGQNRYMQGEQLNLQRSQNTQNIINSTIQNEMSRKTNERLQKQMDLSNAKLEFDMQKEILNGMKAQREELKTMFLDSDQAKIQQALVDAGLDEAGLMRNMEMKGGMNFKNWMEEQVNSRKFINMQKSALDRKYKFDQGEELIKKAENYTKNADSLAKAGLLDPTTYTDFVNNLNASTKKLIDYNSGKATDLDFTDDTWSKVTGFQEFLDEVQMKSQLEMTNKVNTQKLQNEMLETNALTNKLKLDEKLQPFEVFTKMTDSYKRFGEASNVFSALATHFPGVDFNNPDAFMTAFQAAPAVVQESMRDALKKDVEKEDNVKDIEQGYARALQSGNPAEIAKWENAYKLSKQTSHTVNSDEKTGLPYVGTSSNRVFMQQGKTTDANGVTKAINIVFPGATSNYVVETSGKKEGKVKINVNGKDYFHDIYEDGGQTYLKITNPAFLEATLGRAEAWGPIGSNELIDYATEDAGDFYIGIHGGVYNEEMKAILIPTSPYGDTQVDGNAPAGASGTNW